jgi:hypothetical protein
MQMATKLGKKIVTYEKFLKEVIGATDDELTPVTKGNTTTQQTSLF